MARSKKIVALVLLMITGGCGYGSRYEAENACARWKTSGGYYTETFNHVLYVDFGVSPSSPEGIEKHEKRQLPLRSCEHEKDTQQFLGFELKTIKNGETVQRDLNKNYGRQITAKFQY